MKDFKKVAQEVASGSFIQEGREKLKSDLIIAAYPNGFTIDGADIAVGTNKAGEPEEYGIFSIAEDPLHYGNAGKILTGIIKEWMDGYKDGKAMSADLKAAGGVKVKMEKRIAQSGNTFIAVTIL